MNSIEPGKPGSPIARRPGRRKYRRTLPCRSRYSLTYLSLILVMAHTPSQLLDEFSRGSASKARSRERMSQILRPSTLTGAGILPSATISANFAAEMPMYIAASSRDKPRRGSGRISERARAISYCRETGLSALTCTNEPPRTGRKRRAAKPAGHWCRGATTHHGRRRARCIENSGGGRPAGRETRPLW
jgi:hypothetical protein